MTYEEFHQEMNNFRQREIKEADLAKEMNLVWINLQKLYLRFDDGEKKMANQVIGEWLKSEDSTMRGDAECMVSMCNIQAAAKELDELANRLVEAANPTFVIRCELENVQRILAKIRTDDGGRA
jgi:hypothetical protein